MGEPKHAERYCGKLAPSVDCLTDETTAPYLTYGLSRGGAKELMSFDVAKAAVRAMARGNVQGKTIGDAQMMPGTFVIDRQGIIRYSYYSAHAGDHPPISALLAGGRETAQP